MNCIFPKDRFKPSLLASLHVTLFGNRVFVGIIQFRISLDERNLDTEIHTQGAYV